MSCVSSISDQRALQMSRLSGFIRNAPRGVKTHLPITRTNTPKLAALQDRARQHVLETRRSRSEGGCPRDEVMSDSHSLSVSLGTGSMQWKAVGDNASASAPSQKSIPLDCSEIGFSAFRPSSIDVTQVIAAECAKLDRIMVPAGHVTPNKDGSITVSPSLQDQLQGLVRDQFSASTRSSGRNTPARSGGGSVSSAKAILDKTSKEATTSAEQGLEDEASKEAERSESHARDIEASQEAQQSIVLARRPPPSAPPHIRVDVSADALALGVLDDRTVHSDASGQSLLLEHWSSEAEVPFQRRFLQNLASLHRFSERFLRG